MSPQNEQIQTENVNINQFQFIERVVGLPVVHSAIEKAKYVYDGTTTRLPIIEQVRGGISHSIIPQILNSAAPLSKPLTTIDGYACKGLDVLEKNIPLIKETPEEIISTGRSIIDSRIITPVSGIVQNIDGLINQAITVSEATVDKISIKEVENPESKTVTSKTKIQRVQTMGHKLRSSAYDSIKSKTPKEVSKLLSIDLIKQATLITNNQAAKVNETFQMMVNKIYKGDNQIQKRFEEYIKDLKTSSEIAINSIMSVSTSKVRETTLSVLLSFSASVTQFTNKASQSVSELSEKMKSTQIEDITLSQLLQKFNQSLSSLKTVSNMLVDLSSRYRILSKFSTAHKEQNEETKEQNEETKEEIPTQDEMKTETIQKTEDDQNKAE